MNVISGLDLTPDILRWGLATAIVLGLVCMTVAAAMSGGSRSRKPVSSAKRLVLYASQTGQAEEIAQRTFTRLSAASASAVLLPLESASPEQLQAAEMVLCVVATTGEGDAPDNGLRFERGIMKSTLDLTHVQFAVLALGDRNYDHFCVFGHRVFAWLEQCGAAALMPCLEVNDLAPRELAQWNDKLTAWGAGNSEDTRAQFAPWRLTSRERLNPAGAEPLYRIGMISSGNAEQVWCAGDLAEIETPDGHRRDYSIASLPSEGSLDLFVREVRTPYGGYGKGSGLLIHHLSIGDNVRMRLKPHEVFHAPAGKGPVLLTGSGSGLAGLRPHILEAHAAGRTVWVIYGERHPVSDGKLCDDLRQLQQKGVIRQLDFAFSRPEVGSGNMSKVLYRREGRISWITWERTGLS
ncbi:MAG: NADPH cytochrome P450 oxidoreductase family protein [Asticcacaulis sp.]